MNYKVKAISTQRLRKDLISTFSILNGRKYFSPGIFQNYFVFDQLKNKLIILMALLGLICGNLMECQKKILKI